MENKQFDLNRRRNLASCLILALLLLSCSKHYSDYLVSRQFNDTTVYFIKEQKNWFNKAEDASFKYDLTYLSSKDSLTINFSVFLNNIKEFDKLILKKESISLSSKLKKLFIEPKGKKIHHRFSSTFSFFKINSLISISPSHPIIILKSEDNKLKLDIKAKDWTEQRTVLQKNFELIKANR